MDSHFGYTPSNIGIRDAAVIWIAVFSFLAGSILFLFSFWHWHRKLDARIQALTGYLERINTGVQGLVFESSDDEFSKLQDEIYKTVTELHQTREEALKARNNFAQNLSNIAHQLKTPITSISLTVQMAKEHLGDVRTAEIQRQINRLMHLEEALLVLSRIDAGTLALDRKPTDVFTILSLAWDNLYELFMHKGVVMDIPEMGEMNIHVDLNWTMEAVMNLMKNCMEATAAGGAVHCSCEKIRFMRRYGYGTRGKALQKRTYPICLNDSIAEKRRKNSGIGIGLSPFKSNHRNAERNHPRV